MLSIRNDAISSALSEVTENRSSEFLNGDRSAHPSLIHALDASDSYSIPCHVYSCARVLVRFSIPTAGVLRDRLAAARGQCDNLSCFPHTEVNMLHRSSVSLRFVVAA